MKKRIIISAILTLLLTGCGKAESVNDATSEHVKKNYEEIYKSQIAKLTDKEICQIIVEDFDNCGEKEAFILTSKVLEGDESDFELWFLNSSYHEKLVDSFTATNSTAIELLSDKYVLFNQVQIRQNEDMQSVIYGVENNKTIKLFSQKMINLFVEENELYAYSYSYSMFEPEFKDWMSLSEQKYHFYWDNETKTCKEYEAHEITETELMEYSGIKELEEKIIEEIQQKFEKAGEITKVEYDYLYREDETIDINVVVNVDDGTKYKYCMTTSCKNNILETSVELMEGNKEQSIIKYLKTR